MARWLLVRHGETEWNAQGRLQGRSATSLSSAGRLQVELLASRLAGTSLKAIYSSDLPGARETGDILAVGRDVRVQPTPDLRERSYGQWEGLTHQQIQARYPEWQNATERFRPPDGESIADVLARVSQLALRLKEAHPGDETVLLVAHSGSLRAITVTVLGLPALAFRRFASGSASLSVISVSSSTAVIELWNDVSHWDAR